MTGITLTEIARRTGGQLEGHGEAVVRAVAGLREAGPDDLSFLANPKYAAILTATRAGGVLVRQDFQSQAPCPLIRVPDPDAAFARIALLFAPPAPTYPPGIHPSAVVAAEAEISPEAHVGPLCVVEPGARIGARTVLVAQCYLGAGAQIGEDSRLYPQVSVREGARIGARVIIHNGAVIGSDGFGFTVDPDGVRTKVPQIGIVEIGDDVEIGAGTTIDRARFGRTIIRRGAKIDNLCQIAHNVVIGEHAVIVSQVGISGSTVIGNRAILAGQTGVAGHLVIGDGAVAEGRSGITKDVPAGSMVYGYPAAPREQAARIHAHVQRLPKLKEKVTALEARVKQLEHPAQT
jgi:UDP-3-O-[3-hydroxymyristoyl] glucosamine N-acyltransferase